MPLVKTFTIYFPQPSGEKNFKARVNCTGDGVFSIKLPPGVEPLIGYGEVSGKDLADVERDFKRALDAYTAARTTRRKVIYYRIGMTAYIMDAKKQKCVLSRDDVSFSTGPTLSIYAGVFEEEEITDAKGGKRYNYHEVASTIPDFLTRGKHDSGPSWGGRKAENVLDWTEARETFFAKIGSGLGGLMLQLDAAFATNDSVAKLADSGGKFLLG